MRSWIKYGLIFIFLICFCAITMRYCFVEKQYFTAMANLKSYANQNNELQNKVTTLVLNTEQLQYYKDSINSKLDSVRKILKVKDRQLKSLQSYTNIIYKTDTIIFKDTIFATELNLDTTIQDNWYKLNLVLQYPNTISVSPRFKSQQYIITSLKKETVNPPKKFFLFRLFQKKHKVLTVDYIEENPYIINTQKRYIEIIK